MRPPICIICDKDGIDGHDIKLISFHKNESDIQWEKEMDEKGFVGHPPWQEWFCKKHYKKAIKLSHLSLNEALNTLR